MAPQTLLLSGLVQVAAGLAFAYGGARFWRSRPASARHGAARAFTLWWLVSGAYNVLAAATAFGFADLDVHLAAQLVLVALAAVCLAGLAYYFLYLASGSRAWLGPVVAFYAAVGGATLAYVLRCGPEGVLVTDWRVDLVYRDPLSPVATGIVLLFLLPQVAGALAYALLARRAEDPVARFRMRLVGGATAAWFLAALAAELWRHPFWQFMTRAVVGLAVAAAIVLAYRPRATGAPVVGRERRRATREALQGRMRDLI
ncbi:MAG TPA: hypothetical protein VHH36_03090 [Candidatus Thermoplasmatota archaeon]|nr:hypothetical protein [Candidatus Thermoplasmatota archaeon]